jgi:hypothetical protein
MKLFRRRIAIAHSHRAGTGDARAVLEDDFHHFRIRVQYREGRVSGVNGWALRSPYSACGDAASQLNALVGMALAPVAHSVIRSTDAHIQCTHMLDLAGLCIAAAARGMAACLYEIDVPRRNGECTLATLYRDGIAILRWNIDGDRIIGPAPYSGIGIREGMARWALATLSAEEAEAALVLRRCVVISRGRERDLDLQIHAYPTGNCYAQQPGRALQATRIIGSTLDFTACPEALCAADQEFLDMSTFAWA